MIITDRMFLNYDYPYDSVEYRMPEDLRYLGFTGKVFLLSSLPPRRTENTGFDRVFDKSELEKLKHELNSIHQPA